MQTADFDYDLPPEQIAQQPLADRTAARLLVLNRDTQTWRHRRVADLPELLQTGDMLVFNESRVLPARLHGRKPTGGKVEVLLVRPVGRDRWQTMTRPALRLGQTVQFGQCLDRAGDVLEAEVRETDEAGLRILEFNATGAELWTAIHRLGEMPLPPYIREPLADPERYQTVYARTEGSVAAPTAGLHFTPPLLNTLARRGIQLEFLTLHVGPGTFTPVKADDLSAHVMHPEWYSIPDGLAARLNAAQAEARRIIAVGTTTVRALESAAASEVGEIRAGEGETRLFIHPGYRFRVVEGMLTNFHLPKSTLLMLVSAFAGRGFVLAAYHEAIREQYRFYSFGDAMLIL